MTKKWISILCVFTLCLSLMPAGAWANDTANTSGTPLDSTRTATFDGLTITGGTQGVDFSYSDSVLTINTSTALSISGLSQKTTITVPQGVAANITLNGVMMMSSTTSPISISEGASLNLTLTGNNDLYFRSAVDDTAPVIYNKGTLTIDGTGKITVGTSDPGVLVGCKAGEPNGSIQMNGGSIRADMADRGTVLFGAGSNGAVIINAGYVECMDTPLANAADNTVIINGGYFDDADMEENTLGGVPVSPNYVGIEWIENRPYYTIVKERYPFIISAHSAASSYSYENNVLTLKDGADLTVSTDGVCYDKIVVADNVSASLTLKDADFAGNTNAIFLPESSKLTLHLEGENRVRTYAISTGATIRVLGDLIIDGSGELSVSSQSWGAAIGGDQDDSSGTITINGGTIHATNNGFGAAIGGGNSGRCGAIIINSGTVNAINKGSGAGIGSGYNGSFSFITINGGAVTASGGNGSAGIGGTTFVDDDNSSILISDGSVTATGGHGAAGIGSGLGSNSGTIVISGGTITAVSPDDGAGIGSGGGEGAAYHGGSSKKIIITGGVISAVSVNGAGIGCGGNSHDQDAGMINISGGVVTASSTNGQGIGTGTAMENETPSTPGTFVTDNGNAIIIASSIGDQSQKANWSGVVFENKKGTVYGQNITMTVDATIPEDCTLTISDNHSLTIAKGVTLTNDGVISASSSNAFIMNHGHLINNGTLAVKVIGDGKMTVSDDQGNKVTITTPDGGIITPADDNSLNLPGGSTVELENGTTITIPENGGTLDLSSGSVSRNFTVFFDSQGGSSVASKIVKENALVPKPEDPTKDGHTFIGWYKDAACTKAWNFDSMKISETTTLYAGWHRTGSSGGVDVPDEPDQPEKPDITVDDIFNDVAANAWYIDAVQYAYDNGLMTGTSATTFEPNTTTTRAMIVAMLHRLEGGPAGTDVHFSDVTSDAWYADSVAWAASEGIVGGFGDGTFQPNAAITREQMASILYRFAEHKGLDMNARADLDMYIDAASISPWASDVISWAVAEGLLTGVSDDTLAPQGIATRAQVAAMFQRFLENVMA